MPSSATPPPVGGAGAGSSKGPAAAAKVDASHLTQLGLKVPHKFVSQPLEVTGILAQHSAFDPLPPATHASYASARSQLPKRPIALLLHGVLAHKDQTYHKGLIARLPIDSFRFDFRSNHETPPTSGAGGGWGMAKFDEDLDDMRSVILHLRERYNYHVHLLIGHSRGALDGFAYYSKWADAMRQDPEERIPYYVSLSARWRMHRIHDRDNVYIPAFAKEGLYRWNVRVAGKDVESQIRPQDVEQFANFPIAEHVRRFPLDSDALLIHGTSDTTVPTADVAYYVNELSAPGRRPGSCTLHLVENGNHNFNSQKGLYEEVIERITSWYAARTGSGAEGAAARAGLVSPPTNPPESATEGALPTDTGPGMDPDALENSWRKSVDGDTAGKGKL